MSNIHSTGSSTDPENFVYPTLVSNSEIHAVAEDHDEYNSSPRPINISCEDLESYIRHRLEGRKELPTRLHYLFDDLSLLLRQREEIDVFDLLVELILITEG